MRDKMKKQLRYASAKDRAEKHESGYENLVFKLPEGRSRFSFKKAGIYRLDFLPYLVKKDSQYADAGELHYEKTYFVHRNIGSDNETYCCLKKTFDKNCPICEYSAKLHKDYEKNKEMILSCKPKERQLFNVIDLENPDKGIQLFDCAFFLFGKMLDDKIKNADPDDNYPFFFHFQGGMTVKVAVSEESFNGTTYYKASNIEMKPRKDYDDDVFEDVLSLDDLLKEVPYEKLKKVFLQSMGEEEEESYYGSRSTKSKSKDEDEDEVEVEDQEDEEEEEEDEAPVSKKKAVIKDEDEDEDEEDDDDDDDDDDDEDDDEEESKSKSVPAKRQLVEPSKDDDDDDDDMDEEDDDEDEQKPRPRGRGRPRKS